jgi:acetylornithine deacetylase/succinyl-diaminopimelate desuccinylase-like protein
MAEGQRMTNSMSDWRLTQQWPGWALLFVVVSVTSSCNTAHAPDVPPRAPNGRDTGVQRPAFSIGAAEPFDAARIPAYGGEHAGIYADIDRHQVQHRENLRRWLRQPSISAEDVGIQQMAEMLRGDLQRIGFKEAEIVPTSGHPGVWGYYDAGADRTLAVYMMYDVQPVEAEGWQVPAFEAPLVDHRLGRAVIARGATNQKGPQRAFLNAVEAIIRTTGSLPVNLMIVAEGEEELGSPHIGEIIDRYEARLRTAAGVLFPSNGQGPDGRVSMSLGVKGIVYFEMEARGGEEHGGPQQAEVHGSLKALVDSPVWRLTQALASLTTPDGNTVVVPGYYDAIRPPSDEEQRLAAGMLDQWRAREPLQRQTLGVARWIDGLEGEASLMRGYFGTTLNINGIWSGYSGPGTKTILPHIATAKVDSRLVPGQTPEEALRLIREHLDAQGFGDIEIRRLGGYPPAQTSVEAPLVQAAIAAYNKHGLTPAVAPRIFGSAPYHVFTDRLQLPMISGGLGHGSGAHAPNEYMVLEPAPGSGIADLAQVEKFHVDLLHALAEAQAAAGRVP